MKEIPCDVWKSVYISWNIEAGLRKKSRVLSTHYPKNNDPYYEPIAWKCPTHTLKTQWGEGPWSHNIPNGLLSLSSILLQIDRGHLLSCLTMYDTMKFHNNTFILPMGDSMKLNKEIHGCVWVYMWWHTSLLSVKIYL